MIQLGLPEPSSEQPQSPAQALPRYGEAQGRLSKQQVDSLAAMGTPPEQFDYLQVFFMAGFYLENPVFLMDDLPDEGVVQFLADQLGEHRPYQLVAQYGFERIRATVRGCLVVYGRFDWQAEGIENPAAYLRSLLAKRVIPGRGRAPEARDWFTQAERRSAGATKWS